MQCPISDKFLTLSSQYVLPQNFQNWNIIFTIHNNFWRHSLLLIDYIFMIKEDNHHDLTSRFGLLDFFLKQRTVCFHILVVDLVTESKWCTHIIPTLTAFRKFQIILKNLFPLIVWILACICSSVRCWGAYLEQTWWNFKLLCRMQNINGFEMLVDAPVSSPGTQSRKIFWCFRSGSAPV